jgi:hypothetical protein
MLLHVPSDESCTVNLNQLRSLGVAILSTYSMVWSLLRSRLETYIVKASLQSMFYVAVGVIPHCSGVYIMVHPPQSKQFVY